MSIKLQIGRLLNYSFDNLIKRNYKLASFIPNGRYLALDLKRAGINPDTILDVGANVGQTANYFIKHFPDALIYSFEPVADTYKQLLSNLKSKRVTAINQGLGERIEQLDIHKNNASGSSSLQGNDGRFLSTETVSINTGAAFCQERNIKTIDLLKMDVEGHEIAVLKGFNGLLQTSVKMIYTEIGFDPADRYKTYIGDLLEITTKNGFVVSGFYEPYRWGNGDFRVFYNVLLVNTKLLNV